MLIVFFFVFLIAAGLFYECLRAVLRSLDERLPLPAKDEDHARQQRRQAHREDAIILIFLFGFSLFVLLLLAMRGLM